MPRLASLSLVVVALSAPLPAQEAAESPTPRSEPVFVTARRLAVDPFEEPSILYELDREELDRRMPRSVPEALWDVPGVMVQKTANGQGSPFLRGFTGFRTLLLIDGIRLNNSVFREGPNQYWSTIDPYSIDRIEVVKGPTSVLYGSDAIGGVVQAHTRRREEFSLDLDWSGAAKARVAEAERSVMSRVETEGNAGEEVGWYGGYSFAYFGDVRDGSGNVQDATGNWQQAADGKATIRPDRRTELTFAHYEFDQNEVWRTHSTDEAVPFHGTQVGTDRMRKLDQDRRLSYGRLQLDQGPFFDRFTATASLHTQAEEEKRERSDGRRSRQEFTVTTPALQAQFDSATPVGTLSYGAEWYHDDVESSSRDFGVRGNLVKKGIQGPVADESNHDTLAGYVQQEIDLFDDLVTLVVGGRYTHTWVDADEVENPASGRRLKLHDAWPSAVGSFRGTVRPVDEWHLFAGVNQGFRAPNLSDLTRLDSARSGEIEVPSPGLDPEHFLTMEAGSKIELDTLSFQGAYYYTRIWDMILRRPNGQRIGRDLVVVKSNAGDGFVHGVEGEAAWRFLPDWQLSGHVSWQESLVEQFATSAPVIEEDNLSRMQPLSWGGALLYEDPSGAWFAEVSSRFALRQDRLSPDDERDTQRISPGGTPSYAIFTVRGGYDVNDDVRLTAAVENATDENYRILGSGSQEAGVNAVLGVEVRFP